MSNSMSRVPGRRRMLPPTKSLDALYPKVYAQLGRLAHDQRARLGASETLDTTAIVHEAYRRLTESDAAAWNDRTHCLGIAGRAMPVCDR